MHDFKCMAIAVGCAALPYLIFLVACYLVAKWYEKGNW